MKSETKREISGTQSEVAFRLQNLMMVNLKDAFRTFDSRIISKYLKISNIKLREQRK